MKRSMIAGLGLALGMCMAMPAFAWNASPYGATSGVNGGTSLDFGGGPGFSSSYSGVSTDAHAKTSVTPTSTFSVGGSNTSSYNHTRGNGMSEGSGGSNYNAGSWLNGNFGHHYHHDD